MRPSAKHTPTALFIRQRRHSHANGIIHTPTAFHIKAQGRDSAPWVPSPTANPVPQRGSTYTCGTPLGYEPRGMRHIPTCAIATLGFGMKPPWGKVITAADSAAIFIRERRYPHANAGIHTPTAAFIRQRRFTSKPRVAIAHPGYRH